VKKLIFIIGFMLLFGNAYSQSGWYLQYYSLNFENNQSNIFFIDSLTGWYSPTYYSDYDLYKTTNGGNNWEIIDSNYLYITSIFFIDQNNGWMSTGTNPGGGNLGRIYISTNAGLSWTQQIIPINQSPVNDKGVSNIKFLNSNTGYACGYILYLSGQALMVDTYVLKTINGGTNWTVSLRITTGDITDYPWWFNKLDFVDENNVWVTGTQGRFYHSTNGGINWVQTSINNGGNYIDLKFINKNTGYVFNGFNGSVTGWHCFILKTTNGGSNFITLYSTNILKLFGFCFLDLNNGYMCGDSNIIMKTTNGGINWTTQNTPIFSSYNKIYFYNLNTGWAIDNSGHILKTTTGGITFSKKTDKIIPDKYYLSQNYPNPFNPATNIKYQITNNLPQQVTLIVYDILGKELATLVKDKLNAGEYETTFNGSGLTSGIYFYKLFTEGFTQTKKMILLK
jgi:photosystem II stability/assembly factor-like uncharacterized protein